jgi:hypothetical protein
MMRMWTYKIELTRGVRGLLYEQRRDYKVLTFLVNLTIRSSKGL